MSNNTETGIIKLVDTLAREKTIRAIGISGGERPFPEPREGDIDLFVYCSEIPARHERQATLMSLADTVKQVEIAKLAAGHWGEGDCLSIGDVETWLLYFTVAGAHTELEAILSGQYLGRLDSYYYPIGRCAMWKTMRVFYDPDAVLASFKERLAEYPQELAMAVTRHHLKALEDVEDLERAAARKDVFFFHFALDLALDHFLQALFALNREYFPSRKRSEAYLRDFKVKPAECEDRLHKAVALGGDPETLEVSYRVWSSLVRDINSQPKADYK